MPAFIDASHSIDITLIDTLLSDDNAILKAISEKFSTGVEELKSLVLDGAVLFCPTSMGKDSTSVCLMALEAYRQLISEGAIAPSHPLIFSTVNTGMEQSPMNLYVAYAKKRVEAFAAAHQINLQYQIVKPALNDQYFVRFVGGQKLLSHPSRNGDCSIILKVKPSEAYVKSLASQYSTLTGSTKIVTCLGSRLAEGTRRAGNMAGQGISHKSIEDLKTELTEVTVGQATIYNFAPIRNWSVDDVFNLLRIAGSKPLSKVPGVAIPAFLDDFGLLIAIYGNGSNETCSVAIGQQTTGAGCNGRARYGCIACTMVGATDNSSTALTRLTRWNVLGAESALRVRDYMFRLAGDMNARAYHARAYDATGFSRVAMQPNILKPAYLEKIVRYAAQLTLDAYRIASEFKTLVAQGRELEHPGMQCIANDESLNPKTKRAMLQMYREGVQNPENLNTIFTLEHAALLSYRWAVDGIAAAPFRPLAIYKQLEAGKGWLPYPPLNSELAARGLDAKPKSSELPEAILFPIFKDENHQAFAANPIDGLSLWTRPEDISDVHEPDFNCTIGFKASHYAKAEATYLASITVQPAKLADADVFSMIDDEPRGYRLLVNTVTIQSGKLNGKVLPEQALSLLAQSGFDDAARAHLSDTLDAITDAVHDALPTGSAQQVESEIAAIIHARLPGTFTLKRDLRHLRNESLFTGYMAGARKVEAARQFSRRITKINAKGKAEKGNTRLVFYRPQTQSRMHQALAQYTDFLVPDFTGYHQKHIVTHTITEQDDINELVTENIVVNPLGLNRWLETDGLARAIALHDTFFESRIRRRHIRGTKKAALRQFGGTFAAEMMMEQGVISINAAYTEQLQYIMRRTQFFDSLGLFSMQSQSHEQLLAHPKAISMFKHRHDKALIMSCIRSARNAQRNMAKQAILEQQAGRYSQVVQLIRENLNRFEQVAIDAINTMTTTLASNLFHLRFHTHHVSAKDMANVSALWSHLFLSAKNVDELLAVVLTPAQQRNLKTSPTDYMRAVDLTNTVAGRLVQHIELQHDTWIGTIDKLNMLLKTFDGHAPLEAYRQVIHSSPYAIIGYDDLSFRPSAANFKSIVGANIDKALSMFTLLHSSKSTLETICHHGKRETVRKMGFASRMAVLTKRAA